MNLFPWLIAEEAAECRTGAGLGAGASHAEIEGGISLIGCATTARGCPRRTPRGRSVGMRPVS